MSKTNFDNKIIRFNRKITSNITKYLEVQKKLNSLTTKDYNFFLGVVYQPTLDTLELKKHEGTDYFLIWESKWVQTSKLKYILLSCIA